MATFPYYGIRFSTAARELQFSLASSSVDITLRDLCAAWLLQSSLSDEGHTAVQLYLPEVQARDITTEPHTGAEIRAYRVARRMLELAARDTEWDTRLSFWLSNLIWVQPSLIDALLHYSFNDPDLNGAVIERVHGINQVYTERASNINLEQTLNGQVVTYAAGVAAFDRGQNMQVWGGATNLIASSNDFTTWNANSAGSGTTPAVEPLNDDSPASGMKSTRVILDLNGGTLIGDISTLDLGQTVSDAPNENFSIFIKSNTTENYTMQFNFSGANNVINVTQEWVRHNFTPNVNASNSLRVQLRGQQGTSDFADVLLFQADHIETTYVQPPIYTSGAPATRAPTAESISTFTTPAYWIDSPLDGGGVNAATAGDFTDANYTNGVHNTNDNFTFLATGGNAGKYPVNISKFIGAYIYLNNGDVIRITTNLLVAYGYDVIKGNSASVRIALQYPNTWTIDFTQSDYFTGSLAADSLAVFNLRVAAGDLAGDLNALGVPALIPVTDIVISLKFKFFSAPLDFHKAIITGITDSLDGWVIERNQGASRWVFVDRGFVLSASSPIDVLSEGDEVLIELEVSSINGTTLIVNGNRGVPQAALTSISDWLVGNMRLFSQLNGTRPTNAGAIDFTVRPILSEPNNSFTDAFSSSFD